MACRRPTSAIVAHRGLGVSRGRADRATGVGSHNSPPEGVSSATTGACDVFDRMAAYVEDRGLLSNAQRRARWNPSCTTPLVIAAHRSRCPATTRADRQGTKVCAIPLTRRPSRRSSRLCALRAIDPTALVCAPSSFCYGGPDSGFAKRSSWPRRISTPLAAPWLFVGAKAVVAGGASGSTSGLVLAGIQVTRAAAWGTSMLAGIAHPTDDRES